MFVRQWGTDELSQVPETMVRGPGGGSAREGSVQEPLGAVEKALRLLAAFERDEPPVGVSELARRVGLAKSTAHRLLKIMLTYGYVDKEDDLYRLGQRCTGSGGGLVDHRLVAMRDRLLPYLLEIYTLTHEVVHLAVLIGTDVLYLETLCGPRVPQSAVRSGTRVPAGSTVLGWTLLAYSVTCEQPATRDRRLAGIRQRGLCWTLDPAVPGWATMAVPVLRPDRTAAAAISVTGPTARLAKPHVLSHLRTVCHRAQAAVRTPSFAKTTSVSA